MKNTKTFKLNLSSCTTLSTAWPHIIRPFVSRGPEGTQQARDDFSRVSMQEARWHKLVLIECFIATIETYVFGCLTNGLAVKAIPTLHVKCNSNDQLQKQSSKATEQSH